ncbi:MAG: N-formylglutamate amidohydrolase [Bauldia sp.]|nr:N-formylglutamate amidohydrolase [Bauldia sp.]
MIDGDRGPEVIENPDGAGAFVIVCDHASNTVPFSYDLALPPDAINSHIGWDPGALPVARDLSERLDAPLLWPDISRLVIDCNRPASAPDLIVTEGEGRPVPGNRALPEPEREKRLATIHTPYHAAIDAMIDRRLSAGLATSLIAIHSFTPTWHGAPRPWQIGIVFDEDRRLSAPLIDMLSADATLTVGVNEPYSPADRVYYTMARHGSARGLPAVMIEIRNDLIATEAGQQEWAGRLAPMFEAIARQLPESGHAAA